MLDILCYFSKNIFNILQKHFKGQTLENLNNLEEIRIRSNGIIELKYNNKSEILKDRIKYEDILETLQIICDNSIYSYQNEICNGYITIKGGHRIGITGNCVIENDKVINIKYISSLNFRIARQIIGCSNKILQYILDLKNNTIYNTLIISPPGAGKTTILRDSIRNISNGIEEIKFNGMRVGIVDERGEIAALYKGIPQNDIGFRTDILENVSKPLGIKMLIRSMSPQVIAADEIGNVNDVEAIKEAISSGIKGIFTAHGSGKQDLFKNPVLNKLIGLNFIERIIFLKKDEEERNIEVEEKVC